MVVMLSVLCVGRPLPSVRFLVLTSVKQTLSRPQGHGAVGIIMSITKSNDLFGNQTLDLPACSSAATNYVTVCRLILYHS
jgi:hypothetical protein